MFNVFVYLLNKHKKSNKMKTLTALKRFSASLLVVFLIASCSSDDDNNPITPTPQQNNIVDLALANPELSSLVAALQA
ncbi:MAG: adhesin, partial [Flavobacteriaceae bacterium]|nr:adhesin [Flavobacteriaceae bacterium]